MPYWLADLARGNLEAQLENCAVRTDTDIPELKAKVQKFDALMYTNCVSLNAVEPSEQMVLWSLATGRQGGVDRQTRQPRNPGGARRWRVLSTTTALFSQRAER